MAIDSRRTALGQQRYIDADEAHLHGCDGVPQSQAGLDLLECVQQGKQQVLIRFHTVGSGVLEEDFRSRGPPAQRIRRAETSRGEPARACDGERGPGEGHLDRPRLGVITMHKGIGDRLAPH
ncbi:hypothetical protein D9C01_12550, partial [Corynebacterium diphtheriae]